MVSNNENYQKIKLDRTNSVSLQKNNNKDETSFRVANQYKLIDNMIS